MLNYINRQKQAGNEINRADVAASFQQAVMDVIVEKAVNAVKMRGEKKLVLAGGVAANSKLREMLGEACGADGITLYRPAPALCTDNGAMIGAAAYYKYKEKGADGLELDAYANMEL